MDLNRHSICGIRVGSHSSLFKLEADICGRMRTYADVCGRMRTYADVFGGSRSSPFKLEAHLFDMDLDS